MKKLDVIKNKTTEKLGIFLWFESSLENVSLDFELKDSTLEVLKDGQVIAERTLDKENAEQLKKRGATLYLMDPKTSKPFSFFELGALI